MNGDARARWIWVVVLAACSPEPDPGVISVPGSPIKIAEIDSNTYSISLDGSGFSRPLQTSHELVFPAHTFDPTLHVPQLASQPAWLASLDARPSQLYLVQFITPPLQAMRAHLRDIGAEPFGYFPNDALIVRMTDDVASRVERQSYVRWVGAFRPSLRIASDLFDVA